MSGRSSYGSFADFYPFYLSEHSDRRCRRLHFLGTALLPCVLLASLASGRLIWLWALPLVVYGFAWVGHFFFERNRPATFAHPLYSLLGDFVMFRDIVTGRIPF